MTLSDPRTVLPSQCGFVPPYLLRRLAAADHPTMAISEHPCGHTLRIDQTFRRRRLVAPQQELLRSAAAGAVGDRWVIHSANNEEVLPGDVVRREGDPVAADPAVDEAYDWTAQVWDLYASQFNRVSFDGAGSEVTVTVHYSRDYDNAFWDGAQLVFGDGDGDIFERFTKPADVLAHEFTHGVVQFTAGLIYHGQPGALNESLADVFASMSIQRAADQTAAEASWLIGEGLFRPNIKAKALRSMLEPGTAYDDPRLGKDPQVGSMADYVDSEEDDGGVHINSGIPNRAFALAARAIGGRSWERAGQIWYAALTSTAVGSSTDFREFAEATVAAATEQFPGTQIPVDVRAAWVEVGVLETSGPVDVVDPPSNTPVSEPVVDQPASTDSATPGVPRTVAVRRSGGFTGYVRRGKLDLAADPRGDEVRGLLHRVDLQQVSMSNPAPDRFVYTVEFGEQVVTAGEQDLPPELQQVVRIVLASSSTTDDLGDPGVDLT
ncbi:MAG: M4 family metallopeptidase [Microlunatus sp.]|nr:M4 family metallopeptidase [Microlunatus sp.]MDN5771099.1 M4 family metallopeptidase [Microlunatus sp.]